MPAAGGPGPEPVPLKLLGDGTGVVPGHRGEVRLSADRKRWWNGMAWELTATSTPPDALRDQDGNRKRWWDGADWRPVGAVRPWWQTPAALLGLHAVPFVLLLLAIVTGEALLWVIGVVAYAAWAVVVIRSPLLGGRAKALPVLLSVVGIGVELLLRSREQRAREGRVGASASRL